ncbi:MAG: YeaH/YhbH family protein [Pseudomonadota bacterium]
MSQFIDRRLNPKDKSLGNRRRFIRRVRKQVKAAVNQAVRERSISDISRGDKVGVAGEGIHEPQFHYQQGTGNSDRVLPGNKDFAVGDRLRKPPRGGKGSRGRQGSDQGDGEDDFLFVLSKDEFLDIFFEDLELPDLVKHTLKEVDTYKPKRSGYSSTGNPANLAVARTMRNALGRRIALNRPNKDEIKALQAKLFELERVSEPTASQKRRMTKLRKDIAELTRRQKSIPYIDPLDVRYKTFEQQPEPNANAVMFCLMDVSASMGEREKDLAKRFFVLLHLFLQRRYDRIDVVFIRHTHNAEEVDEETFFYGRESGGTVVSTALEEMKRIIHQRYPSSDWNIYAAQASDGDNFSNDCARCHQIMQSDIMPLVQYFAYIEIIDEAEASFLSSDETGVELWETYKRVSQAWGNFAMKRIASPADIYPVFRELFKPVDAREPAHA